MREAAALALLLAACGSAGEEDGDAEPDSDSDTGSDSESESATATDTGSDSDTASDGGSCSSASGGTGGVPGLSELTVPRYEDFPATVYVPSTYDEATPMPYLIALHGSGDRASSFVGLWQSIAEDEGFVVLVPESTTGGIGWQLADVALIDLVDAQAREAWNLDLCRAYLTGYSAGAHFTYLVGLANSERFAALGVQAGSLAPAAEPSGVWPDDLPRKIPVDIHHGTTDPVVPFAEAERARDELEAAGHVVYFHTHPGGHELPAGNADEMWAELRGNRLR